MAKPTIKETMPIPAKITVVSTPKLDKTKNNHTNKAEYLITEIRMVIKPLVFFKKGNNNLSNILRT